MRSVVVVFPASMCAMIPMLRVSLRGACLAMVLPSFSLCLPCCSEFLGCPGTQGCPDFRSSFDDTMGILRPAGPVVVSDHHQMIITGPRLGGDAKLPGGVP